MGKKKWEKKLERYGKWNTHCPWCTRYALTVNSYLRLFHCFACREGGDLTKLAEGPWDIPTFLAELGVN